MHARPRFVICTVLDNNDGYAVIWRRGHSLPSTTVVCSPPPRFVSFFFFFFHFISRILVFAFVFHRSCGYSPFWVLKRAMLNAGARLCSCAREA